MPDALHNDARLILARAAQLFASAPSLDQALKTLATLVVPAFCEWSIIDLAEPSGVFRRVAVAHDPAKPELEEQIRKSAPDPWDVRSGGANGHSQLARKLGARALHSVPLLCNSRLVGVWHLGSQRTLAAEEQLVIDDLASRAAMVASHAWLIAETEEAWARAGRAAKEAEFLDECGRIVMSSLEIEQTLVRISRHAVPLVAHGCAIDLRHERVGDPVGAQAAIPSLETTAEVFHAQYHHSPFIPAVLRAKVQRQRAPILLENHEIDLALAGQPEIGLLRQMRVTSLWLFPLIGRSDVVGVAGFVKTSGPATSTSSRRIAEQLCQRLALAIENDLLYREAQIASRSKDEFLAIVSHELRTPLTAMSVWANLLAGGRLDERRRHRALEVIRDCVQTQGRLIEDLLDISRIISGKLHLELSECCFVKVVRSAVDALRPSAELKRLTLTLEADGELQIFCDPSRMRQVVCNLLANAIKFTPSDGKVHVRVSAGERVQLTVADSGAGISEEFLPHVFESFRQEQALQRRSAGGLGLGLAIVRHIVQEHGGTIQVESAGPGQGTTVTLELPVQSSTRKTIRNRTLEDLPFNPRQPAL